MKWKQIVCGVVLGGLCWMGVSDADTLRNKPASKTPTEAMFQAFRDYWNTDGSYNEDVARIVNLSPDVTTFSVGTASAFYTGSNTTATAITDVTGGTAGQIFTIVTTGGANWTTIADSGNFNIAGQGGFVPDSADDSITFLIQADNDYVQLYGTQTNN